MSIDTLLNAAPGMHAIRTGKTAKSVSHAKPAQTDATHANAFKRMPASELLKALLGIRDRQKKLVSERVTVRMSVVTPRGRPAISLWLNGRDSLA